jgi:hypothetical protein
VIVGAEFLGVVGADVPVSRLETLLLRDWGRLGADVVVVNADGRVVVGNTADALPGERRSVADGPTVVVPDVGWRLSVTPAGADGTTGG